MTDEVDTHFRLLWLFPKIYKRFFFKWFHGDGEATHLKVWLKQDGLLRPTGQSNTLLTPFELL